MADADPKSRPEPPPGPSVYGGQWGEGGKPDPKPTGKRDRPQPIKTPPEAQGHGDPDTPNTSGGER